MGPNDGRIRTQEFDIPDELGIGKDRLEDSRGILAGGGGGGVAPAHAVDLGRSIIDAKQREYTRNSRRHRRLYYSTRLMAGLAAALLPFVVGQHPTAATVLSVIVAVTVVLDVTLDPKGRWQLYSKASDLLAIARLKASGDYDRYKDELEILLATETQKLERLVDLESVLKKVSGKQ
jgi:uncharacterized protein DUF4231